MEISDLTRFRILRFPFCFNSEKDLKKLGRIFNFLNQDCGFFHKWRNRYDRYSWFVPIFDESIESDILVLLQVQKRHQKDEEGISDFVLNLESGLQFAVSPRKGNSTIALSPESAIPVFTKVRNRRFLYCLKFLRRAT
jgi:hypothetical protein